MVRLRNLTWLWSGLLSVQIISAQGAPPNAAGQSTDVARSVELMIRLRFEIPTACDIKIGSRTPSQFTGYDTLRVILTQADRLTDLEFLISKDNKSLVRLENFDLDHYPALSIDIHGRPVRGNPEAQVTVINFDDLECPVCARMHELLKTDLMKKYGDKVRFIYRDNPLTEIHPWAMHAAVDAGCLARQDATSYWTFVDYVHTHGEEVSGAERDLNKSFSTLDRIAATSSEGREVDKTTLLACLRKQDEEPVRQSMREAQSMGLDFTPALFVNGELVRGLISPTDPQRAIDRALQTEKAK